MRYLYDEFINDLKSKNGVLNPILEYVNDKRNNIYFGVRKNEIHLYYRGGVLGKLKFNNKNNNCHNYKFSFDNNYANDSSRQDLKRVPKTINKIEESILLKEESFNNLIKIMDIHFDVNKKSKEEKTRNKTLERQAQHLLAVSSDESKSNFYCIDIEYAQKEKEKEDKDFGKYDLILVAKEPNSSKKHKVVLLELKYGCKAYDSNPKEEGIDVKDYIIQQTNQNQNYICNNNRSYGSGITGHFADFYRFMRKEDNYKDLKKDIASIFKYKKELNLINKAVEINENDLSEEPEYWILTLCNNNENYVDSKLRINSCKKALINAFKNNKFSVKKVFGNKYDDLKKMNIKFCFYQGEEVEKDKVRKLDFDCVINENNFIDKDEIFGN